MMNFGAKCCTKPCKIQAKSCFSILAEKHQEIMKFQFCLYFTMKMLQNKAPIWRIEAYRSNDFYVFYKGNSRQLHEYCNMPCKIQAKRCFIMPQAPVLGSHSEAFSL